MKGNRFRTDDANLVTGGLALFKYFPEATEDCFIEWIDAIAMARVGMDHNKASELGSLLQKKGWEPGANRVKTKGLEFGNSGLTMAWDAYWNSLSRLDKFFFRFSNMGSESSSQARFASQQKGMEPPKAIALFVTALGSEFKAICAHLTGIEQREHKGSVYGTGSFATNDLQCEVVVVQTGMGNAKAAVETERAIAQFSPQFAFFVGIAGGLKEDLNIGDVVAADKVYGYESGKASDEFKPRSDAPWTTHDAIQRAQAVARDGTWQKRILPATSSMPNAYVKPIAAGEKVVDSHQSTVFKLLKDRFSDAYTVAMEDIGFASAAHANREIIFAVVRGISDLATNKALVEKGNSQEIAARNAAAFAFEMLAGLLKTTRIRPPKLDLSRP